MSTAYTALNPFLHFKSLLVENNVFKLTENYNNVDKISTSFNFHFIKHFSSVVLIA